VFGIGMNEFLLILIIGLVVIGPKRLPMVLRTLGQWMTQFKRATNELRDAVGTEINAYQEFRDLREFKDSVEQEVRDFRTRTETAVNAELEPERRTLDETVAGLRQLEGDPGLLTDPEPVADPGLVGAEEAPPDEPPPEEAPPAEARDDTPPEAAPEKTPAEPPRRTGSGEPS